MIYGYEITEEERPTWFVIEKELRGEIYIPCIDHPKFCTDDKEVVLVIEPYNVDMGKIKELTKFCEIRGLQFQIWGDSFHNPGQTFGICINCKDDHKNRSHQFWIDKFERIMEEEEFDRLFKDEIKAFQEKWA